MSEEQGRPESGDGVQWNPQTGFPAPSNPYGQPAPPPPPYQQPPSYQQPPAYGQQPYDPTQAYPQGYPAMPYSYAGYAVPDHPQATAAMVWGIVSLVGGVSCGLPILASPVAWILGHKARKEIRREPQRYGGESKATAGMVMGIIGTVLLVLALVLIVVVVVIAVNSEPTTGFETGFETA
ncbi:MAG: DUF4190 domain-containing protein [Nocardioidaceae bacterium]|nr:DUF4190 domain-containing protein [Nocardioidaceae bacterium]